MNATTEPIPLGVDVVSKEPIVFNPQVDSSAFYLKFRQTFLTVFGRSEEADNLLFTFDKYCEEAIFENLGLEVAVPDELNPEVVGRVLGFKPAINKERHAMQKAVYRLFKERKLPSEDVGGFTGKEIKRVKVIALLLHRAVLVWWGRSDLPENQKEFEMKQGNFAVLANPSDPLNIAGLWDEYIKAQAQAGGLTVREHDWSDLGSLVKLEIAQSLLDRDPQ